MKEEKIGILGYGQVGQAIGKFYKDPKIKDINRDDGLIDIDILHVCIPFSDQFISLVQEEIKNSHAKLTFIHSSVAPGTTQQIGETAVHSPIRGVHPNLYEGIKTFTKFIGADSKKIGKLAKKHLKSLGIKKVKIVYPSIATELGKLFDTTYYGLCIAWHAEMKKICDQFKVNFDDAVTDFNKTYNQGYKKLGKKNVIRPVLFCPPDNVIGGHCIIANAHIIDKFFKSKAIDLILSYSKKDDQK